MYSLKKLSNEDIIILKEIYEELEKINIRKCFSNNNRGQYHSKKTGTCNQKNARQSAFGLIRYQGKYRNSKITEKYPNILPLFEKFIMSHHPTFDFKSVQVNKNTISKKHLDSKNVGDSLIVGLGNFSEGETVLYLNSEKVKIDINTQSLKFNGSKIYHQSEPFEGIRYSLVFFK